MLQLHLMRKNLTRKDFKEEEEERAGIALGVYIKCNYCKKIYFKDQMTNNAFSIVRPHNHYCKFCYEKYRKEVIGIEQRRFRKGAAIQLKG